MDHIDFQAALGIPDDIIEFVTPEEIHQLMSCDDWMSESVSEGIRVSLYLSELSIGTVSLCPMPQSYVIGER